MNEGWIKLHRKILDVPSLKGNYGWLFVVLLLMATHTQKEVMFGGKILKLSPGQFTTGAHQLAVRSHIPRGTVERILKRLKSEERIEVRTDRQCSLITIKNWDTYQQNEERNEERVRNDRGTSEERVRTKQEREECKKEKNVRKYPYSPPRDKKKLKKYTKQDSQNPVWERLCDQLEELGLANHVNPSLYLSTIVEFSARGAVGPEVRACLFWCKDKGLKMVTISRIRNWLKNWAEKMKQKEVQQLAYYQDKKFEQQVKSSEFIKPKLPPVWTPPS